MKKRIWSMGLSVLMLASMTLGAPVASFAEETPSSGKISANGKGRYVETYQFDVFDESKVIHLPSGKTPSLAALSLGSNTYDPEKGYGGELTDQQKGLYDALLTKYVGPDMLPNGDTTPLTWSPDYNFKAADREALMLDIQRAYWAFYLDYPQVFWAGGFSLTTYYKDSTKTSVQKLIITVVEKYAGAKSKIDEYNAGVVNAVNEVIGSLPNRKTSGYYRAIHDWLCDHLTYNNGNVPGDDYKYSSGNVFAGNGSVVCEAYTTSYKILCDQIRLRYHIPLYCADINGVTDEGEYHAWNYVLLEGKWYAIDATWDDQEFKTYHTYYLIGFNSMGFSTVFSKDHMELTNRFSTNPQVTFSYPVLEKVAWDGVEPVFVDVAGGEDGITYSVDHQNVTVSSDEAYRAGYLKNGRCIEIKCSLVKPGTYEFKAPAGVDEVLLMRAGDMNLNGSVNAADYGRLNAVLKGKKAVSKQGAIAADLNGDGELNSSDFAILNDILLGRAVPEWDVQ